MKTLLSGLAVFGGCHAVRKHLNRAERKDSEHLNGCVRLTALWNEGAAFGLKVPREALPLLSAAVLGMVWSKRKEHPLAAGLILGGGLSNLMERVLHGKVYDYISFPKAPARIKQYVFNLADFAVFAGGILLAVKNPKKTR